MAEEKLIGVLRLDTSTLSKDVAQANQLLQSVGKGMNLNLGPAFKKQIADVIAEVQKFAKAAQDAATQAAKVSAATKTATGSSASTSGGKAVSAEAAAVKNLAAQYVRLYSLKAKRTSAQSNTAEYAEIQKQIDAVNAKISTMVMNLNKAAQASGTSAKEQAKQVESVVRAYDR